VLWISCHGGLVRLDLAEWRRAPREPAPVVHLRAATTEGGQPLPLAAGWELPFARRVLHLAFAAPALAGDAAAEFETTLRGEGPPLVQMSPAPDREFAALSAGDYTLQVRTRGSAGVWSPPLEVAFSILPPWWWSPWAWTAYAALGLGAVAGLVAFRTRALRRRAEKLEATIAARTEELRRSNEELARLHRLELDEKTAARLAEEKARLEVLRYQLNPHFLFNALTSVCAQLPPSLPGARATIERLTDFCQATLFRDETHEHPLLADELRMLGAYLEVEKARWGDALATDVRIDPATAPARVPSLLLLPLLENALKYGRETSPDPLHVRLHATRAPDGALVIEVGNTGRWLAPGGPADHVPSLGIGLENLRQRLRRYYAGAHELTTEEADGWVVVRLRLAHLEPSLVPAGPAGR
jgi:signal transduction histidine kinase